MHGAPEVLKYGSLLSLPLFTVVALLLIKKVPDFSFSRHTISKTVLFLNRPIHHVIFRLNFICKAFLDLCFVSYALQHYSVPLSSSFAWVLILAASLFGLLAYFTDDKHIIIHGIIIYSIGVFWTIGELYLAQLTHNSSFIRLTSVFATMPLVLAFGFLAIRKTNVFVQAVCMLIMYGWHAIFVFNYL